MNAETKSVIIATGEDVKFGQGRKYLDGKTQFMGPHSKISAIAAGIVERHYRYYSDIIFVGGDPTSSGREEAVSQQEYMLARFNKNSIFDDKISTLNGLADTSFQMEAVRNELKRRNMENATVSVVAPIEHITRVVTQLRAFGVKVDDADIFESNEVYINDPDITESTRRRRKRIVRKIYKSKQMYLDMIRETGMNIIGVVDPKGLLIRKMSKKFRGGN